MQLADMSFQDYLKSKRNFLVIWFAIHAIALFVNLFNIEGDVSPQIIRNQIGSTLYRNWSFVHLFTDKDYNTTKNEHFWPFVKFYKSDRLVDYNRDGIGGPSVWEYKTDTSFFHGIFYQYDLSEFIAYSLLVFLILYFRWNLKHSNKKSNNITS